MTRDFRSAALRLAGCFTLAAAITAPAFAQLPWWEWIFPPKVWRLCPGGCPGVKTCRQNQYTGCNPGSGTRCICRNVPPNGVVPPF